ncbi:MAG: dephospho-CoA kinase [Verrucomicrobiales bacterium]
MKTVIVTGGIASGKSALCRSFATERDEWEIFDADQAVHGLLTTAQIKLRIADRFGVGILDAGGEIDRRMLGSIVFADSAARRDLETILHPEVFRLFAKPNPERKMPGCPC